MRIPTYQLGRYLGILGCIKPTAIPCLSPHMDRGDGRDKGDVIRDGSGQNLSGKRVTCTYIYVGMYSVGWLWRFLNSKEIGNMYV